MDISRLCINRPVMTTLMMLAFVVFGVISYFSLSVNDLPSVDFPTISVSAGLPGANAETMASAVATPLEKQFSSIAGLESINSTSAYGTTQITLQFNIERSMDGAAQDVQSAIIAARPWLPTNMPNPPTFRKVNPADMPILYMALSSDTLPLYAVDEYAENIIASRISMVSGVAQVQVMGSQIYAPHVQVDPRKLSAYGIGINQVADAVRGANVNLPTGTLHGKDKAYNIMANGQLYNAAMFAPVVVAYQNGAPVRLSDIGRVIDSVQTDKVASWFNEKRGIILAVQRQPGTNTIEIVDAIRKQLPTFNAILPDSVKLTLFFDRSISIRKSVNDVKITLCLTVLLVIVVIILALGSLSTTAIASLTLPISIIGTFAAMKLLDFTINNISLMALTLSVGFVVDDAIVVLENIMRHIELGETPVNAALKGAKEISFTIVSMTLSLVAVFIPILFMGGLIGRLFFQFAATITVAILISGFVSLTLTPMLCSRFLKSETGARYGPDGSADGESDSGSGGGGGGGRGESGAGDSNSIIGGGKSGVNGGDKSGVSGGGRSGVNGRGNGAGKVGGRHKLHNLSERFFHAFQELYMKSLYIALNHKRLVVLGFFLMCLTTVGLMAIVPKGFMPNEDTGQIFGMTQAAEGASFKEMAEHQKKLAAIVGKDPNVFGAMSSIGASGPNSAVNQGRIFMVLKPRTERKMSVEEIIQELRKKTQGVPGISLYLQNLGGIRIGGQLTKAQYQVALSGPNEKELYPASQVLEKKLRGLPGLIDVNTDLQIKNLQINVTVDRDKCARLGISMQAVQDALGSAYAARQISVIYTPLNQYWVILEVLPEFYEDPSMLSWLTIKAADGTSVPLNTLAKVERGAGPLLINHLGQFPSVTLSFNLKPGAALSDAVREIKEAAVGILPDSVSMSFQGTAQAFESSVKNLGALLIVSILVIYIVLGILYESFIHPITILSGLPSAGLGAILILLIFHLNFDIYGFLGLILLVGIVKKNAIMMIDFAVDTARQKDVSAHDAILEACRTRFRPIMMTTMAALLGSLPIAIGLGEGSETRQPLGLTIVGGLVVSQLVTLYITPVFYIYFDRLARRKPSRKPSHKPQNKPESRPETKPESRAESMPENRRESMQENMPENMPENKSENKSESTSESKLENISMDKPEGSAKNINKNKPESKLAGKQTGKLENTTADEPDKPFSTGEPA